MPFDNRQQNNLRWVEAARREEFARRAPVVEHVNTGGYITTNVPLQFNWAVNPDIQFTTATPTYYGGTGGWTYVTTQTNPCNEIDVTPERNNIPKGTKVIMKKGPRKGKIGTIEGPYMGLGFIINFGGNTISSRTYGTENVDFIICSDNEEIE